MFLSQPPQKNTYLPHIVRVKSGQTVKARLAGPPLRCLTHYVSRRTQPCIKNHPQGCPLCQHVANPRYYAYWPIAGSSGLQAAVELTELAELQLLQIIGSNTPALGTAVTFHRPSGRRNNPVEVSLPACLPKDDHARQKKVLEIPNHAIQETLFRLWECPDRYDHEPHRVYFDRVQDVLFSRYTNQCLNNPDQTYLGDHNRRANAG